MKSGFRSICRWLPLLLGLLVIGCAEEKVDHSRPTRKDKKTLSQRLSENQGYTQDSDGNWSPTSDKRSSYVCKRSSPFGQDEVKKKAYSAESYAKKSWWGSKSYETSKYQGDTDGSRFQTEARQAGKVALQDGQRSSLRNSFETNTLESKAARETNASNVLRPRNDYTESQRRTYKAPSVIDWREQRDLSIEESKGILGR